MEYIITIDGSEYLMHHGIKGMKWGAWNAETRQRYLGGGERNAFSDPKKENALGIGHLTNGEKVRHKKLLDSYFDSYESYKKMADKAFSYETKTGKSADTYPGWNKAVAKKESANKKISQFEQSHKIQNTRGGEYLDREKRHEYYLSTDPVARKAGAKRHQESLRKLDKDLRNYTVAEQWLRMSNDAAKNEYVRGRISKKELNDYVNKNTAKKLDAVSSKRKELAKSLIDEVTATKKEGYHVTVRPTNFNPLVYPRGKEFKSTFKQLDKTYGRTKSTSSVPYSPASSGNYFEVRDPRTMTKKQKERATRSESVGKSGSLNSYRPQRIYYY